MLRMLGDPEKNGQNICQTLWKGIKNEDSSEEHEVWFERLEAIGEILRKWKRGKVCSYYDHYLPRSNLNRKLYDE